MRLWPTLLALVLAWGGLSSAYAQAPADLPHVGTDESGLLSLFYPAGWHLRAPDARVLIVSEDAQATGGGPDEQIFVRAQVIDPAPATVEDLRAWLLNRLGLPPGTLAEPQIYAGYAGWLAQGADLRAEGVYSAAVALLIEPGQVALVRADFPSDRLFDVAPELTAMFENLVVLPQVVLAREETLQAHLPLAWPSSDGLNALYTAPTDAALRAVARDETPQPYGVAIRYVAADRDEYLAGLQSVLVEESTFQANGQSVTLHLRQDDIAQQAELRLFRPIGLDRVLELRVSAATPEPLLADMALFKAMFTNLRLQ